MLSRMVVPGSSSVVKSPLAVIEIVMYIIFMVSSVYMYIAVHIAGTSGEVYRQLFMLFNQALM